MTKMEFTANLVKNLPNSLTVNQKLPPAGSQTARNNKGTILFLKNEPKELLKTKDEPKKRTGNEAKNEAGHLVENKGSRKTNPKRTERADLQFLKALSPAVQ